MSVILHTAQAASPQSYTGSHPVGSKVPVHRTADGTAYAEIRGVQPSEILVLNNTA